MIVIVPMVIIISVIMIIIILLFILLVPSVQSKNVNFELFFKSKDRSSFLNLFWDFIQWSHNLYHFATIVVISSFGVEGERWLQITDIKIVFYSYICASSGGMVMDFMVVGRRETIKLLKTRLSFT